jgi:predicted DNA binding CopG/RHH family protein
VERKQVSVYLDAEDLAALKEIAACQGMALSDVIRTVIHQAATRAQQWDDPLDYNPPRRGDR